MVVRRGSLFPSDGLSRQESFENRFKTSDADPFGCVFMALLASTAYGQTEFKSQQTMEVVGFSEDGKLFALKTKDEEGEKPGRLKGQD